MNKILVLLQVQVNSHHFSPYIPRLILYPIIGVLVIYFLYILWQKKKGSEEVIDLTKYSNISTPPEDRTKQLDDLKSLLDSGAITQEEYKQMCRKVMGL